VNCLKRIAKGWTEPSLSRLTAVASVIIALSLQRALALGLTKVAANYAAKGDGPQVDRLFEWAVHFARASHMYGENSEEILSKQV